MKMRSQWVCIAALVALSSTFVACGDDEPAPSTDTTTDTGAPGDTSAPEDTAGLSDATDLSKCQTVCEAQKVGCPENFNGTVEECVTACSKSFSDLKLCQEEGQAFYDCLPADAAWECKNDAIFPVAGVCDAEFEAFGLCLANAMQPDKCTSWCESQLALDCENDDHADLASCAVECQDLVDNPESCSEETQALFDCMPIDTTWTCDDEGDSVPSTDTCADELAAMLECDATG